MSGAMLITVGGTKEPIIKSILRHKPDFVSFFASHDTTDNVSEIRRVVKRAGLSLKSELTLADNVNDLLHCHEKAEEAVKRVKSKGYQSGDVIVDYTGGTKNMSVALALAAITHGFSFSYVGGEVRTKKGIGIVKKGHEAIYRSVNPWDFLAVEEMKKIATLFNTYQFKAAKSVIDGLVDKNVRGKSIFKKLGILIEGYYMWDLFRHKDALKFVTRARIDELVEADNGVINKIARATKAQVEVLQRLSNADKSPCRELILDLFSNAERRFEEKKIDDAVLRLYRTVEMIAQERLLRGHNINTSGISPENIPESLKDPFSCHRAKSGKYKLPFYAAYALLDALNDKLGATYKKEEPNFKKIQSARNGSYLAHGFDSSKEEVYEKLRDFILELEVFEVGDAIMFPKMEYGD